MRPLHEPVNNHSGGAVRKEDFQAALPAGALVAPLSLAAKVGEDHFDET